MSYYFSAKLNASFDEALEKVTEGLKKEGFGILTQIDAKETLKNKLDVDFREYRILGACNPSFAYKALQTEDKIGTMLPCNVIVQETANGEIEIAVVDPIASMHTVNNTDLRDIADSVRSKLLSVINSL